MTGPARADILVARIFERAALITDRRLADSRRRAKRGLDSPKATGPKRGLGQPRLRARFFLASLFPCRLDKFQRGGIQAIAQAGGTRAVVEDVAQMRVAAGADDFRPLHAVAGSVIVSIFSSATGWKKLGQPVPESNFRVRGKKRQIAANTVVNALLVVVVKHAAEGPFGPLPARDPVLFVGELLLPFLVRFDDLLHGRAGCFL